jgi:hypothetical protein
MYANILIGLNMIKVANRIKNLASFDKKMTIKLSVWRFSKFDYYFSFVLIRNNSSIHYTITFVIWKSKVMDLKVSLDFFLT